MPPSCFLPTPSAPPTPRRRWFRLTALARASVFLVAGAVMWVALWYFPHDVAANQMDPSWAQSLAYFVKQRSQAGLDLVFPYGRLGYFATPMYDADLFWLKIAWELTLKLALVVTALRLTRSTLAFGPRLLFCFLLAIALCHNPDGPYDFLVFLLGVSLACSEGKSWRRLLAATFLLATIGLVKHTLLAQAGLMVALSSGRLALGGARWRALLPPACLGAWYVIWWLILGQPLTDLPGNVFHSLEVCAGYNNAMAFMGERASIYLALVILALLGAALVSRSYLTLRGAGNTLAAGVVAVFLFIQWKHGFVRQDLHQIFFFGMTLLCPFLFPALFPEYRWGGGPRPALLAVAVGLSALGLLHAYDTQLHLEPTALLAARARCIRDQADLVFHLGGLKHRLERRRDELAQQFRLPEITARVGSASVDAFTDEQGVLLLNRLHWAPRPIFQSNVAFTPHLQALNAQFLAGVGAPQYLVFQLIGFDGRVPALEDGQALLEICRRYHPVVAEGSNLLLERNGADTEETSPAWKPVRERVAHFDEEIAVGDLTDRFQRVRIDIDSSWEGWIRKTLFRPPLVYLKVRLVNNQVLTYQLIPAIARSGFLLNPWLQETGDVVDLYGASPGKRVAAFWVTTDAPARRQFRKSIRIRVEGAPRLVSEELAESDRKRLRYPMMQTPPDQVDSALAFPVDRCHDRLVLPLLPDGEMRFAAAQGERHVRGQFGILPMAYEQGWTDGVRFTIERVADKSSPPAVLWERSLDPRQLPADRGLQQLDLKVSLPENGQLIFRTSARPGKTRDWCFSFWTDIAID